METPGGSSDRGRGGDKATRYVASDGRREKRGASLKKTEQIKT